MAIIEPENESLLFWIVTFSFLGLLRVFTTLCKDRFDYVCFFIFFFTTKNFLIVFFQVNQFKRSFRTT